MTYLKKKASPAQQADASGSSISGTARKISVNYQPFTWLEWLEFFGLGMVDASDFILRLCFQNSEIEVDEFPPLGKVGGCLAICLIGGLLGLLFLGLMVSLLFSVLSFPNGVNIALTAIFMLLFVVLSLVYRLATIGGWCELAREGVPVQVATPAKDWIRPRTAIKLLSVYACLVSSFLINKQSAPSATSDLPTQASPSTVR
jgi:hypothetical protein